MRDFKFFIGFIDSGLTFYTGGVERLRITSSGHVGFGNINPSYRLDISGLTHNKSYFKFLKSEL
jgi:hypothetical protein